MTGVREYHRAMGIATGIVVAGKVVVDGVRLPEGAKVTVLTPESADEVVLSPAEEEALLAAIEEAERGDTISVEELFQRLDHKTGS